MFTIFHTSAPLPERISGARRPFFSFREEGGDVRHFYSYAVRSEEAFTFFNRMRDEGVVFFCDSSGNHTRRANAG